MENIAKEIVNYLIKHNLTISTCESITGGQIGSFLVSIPNASKCYKGGVISYTNEIKTNIVGVDKKILQMHGAISKQVVEQMAKKTSLKFKTDICIAISGNAGPNIIENKKIGLAYICVFIVDKMYTYELNSNEVDRNNIRTDLTIKTLSRMYTLLKEMEK